MPDAVCPECGEADHTITRRVFRTDVGGKSRKVGSACMCTRCLCEYVVGWSGVYVPRKRALSPNGKPEPKEPQIVRSAAPDEDWSAGAPRRR